MISETKEVFDRLTGDEIQSSRVGKESLLSTKGLTVAYKSHFYCVKSNEQDNNLQHFDYF